MGTLLQILGGAFVLLLVVIVVAYFLIRYKIRKFAKTMKDALENLDVGGLHGVPDVVTLMRVEELRWRSPGSVDESRRRLEGFGFVSDGMFTVQEVDGLHTMGFVRPADGALAAIYEHPQVPDPIVDVVARYDDNGSLTVTNAKQGDEMDHQPGHRKFYLAGRSVEDLLETFQKEAGMPDAGQVKLEAGTFDTVFMKAYAEEMAWRRSRGGATAEEVQRVKDKMDRAEEDEEDAEEESGVGGKVMSKR